MADMQQRGPDRNSSYSRMTRLGRSRTQPTNQPGAQSALGNRQGVNRTNARSMANRNINSADLSVAEKLWHLDTRLTEEKNPELEDLYSKYQSILLFDSDTKNKLMSFEEQQTEMERAYEKETREIANSIAVNDANARTRYQEAVAKYESERDAEIKRQSDLVEANFQNKMAQYNNSYVNLLNETTQAIATGTQIMNNFGIVPSRYNVVIDDKEASSTPTATLLNRIKIAANKINEAESKGSGIQYQVAATTVNGSRQNGQDPNMSANTARLQRGMDAVMTTARASKNVMNMTFGMGKRIKEEREINKQIKEASEEMIRCLKLLTLRKNIAKVICNREMPDESIKKEEIKKIVEAENAKCEINKQKARKQMEIERNQVTSATVKEILNKKKDEYEINLKIQIGKRQDSMNSFKRSIDEKIKVYLEKLHEYVLKQDKFENPFDYDASNAVEASPENILFNKKASYKKMIDVFSEQKLLNSLELKLFLPEGENMRDWYNKIKYDVQMYQRKQSILYDIDKIRNKILVEYNETNGTNLSQQDFSDEALLQFIQKRYQDCINEETRLYDVTTSNKFLGEKVLPEGYTDMPNIISLATNKSYVDKGDDKLFEAYRSAFDNQTLMFVYKNEQEAGVLSNMIKFFIYETLTEHHTESLLVNVVNPTGDVRFKDLQVSRDYISTSADTAGKTIKGPNYVRLFDTQEEVTSLSKDILRQELKLTKNDLVGKSFNTIVHDKRNSGGIVPKFTINVIVNSKVDGNPLSRYNESGPSKGILNIYFIDVDSLLKPSLDQQTGIIKTSISYDVIKVMRTVKCIVEVKEKNRGKSYKIDVSYQNDKTHCLFTYTPYAPMKLEKMRKYLVNRSVRALKNKVFTTTTEYIDDIITSKGLEKRKKEQEQINLDKSAFKGGSDYPPFIPKYNDCRDFISKNQDSIIALQQSMGTERDNYERQLESLEKLIQNKDTEGLNYVFKYLESYHTNLSKMQRYEESENFVQVYDDKNSRLALERMVNDDVSKRQADLDKRNELNPKCYWEGDCLKTLPLYLGYVEGDKTKAQPVILDETSKPHFFIAGTTGGGKSVTLGVLVNTLKMMFNPQDIEVVYFDFKVAEVAMHASPYKMPQCSAMCGSSASEYLISLLNYVNSEMDLRYEMNKNTNTNKLSSLIKYQKNKKKELKVTLGYYQKMREDAESFGLPLATLEYLDKLIEQKKKDIDDVYVPARMLLLVDEAAQAFQTEDDNLRTEVRRIFIRLAQLARAAGIHMLLVSQDADKMPDSLMNLLKTRGCTVAPKAISSNVIKNDFCARPENQFVGFFGVNDMDGAEEGNIQYVVPFNMEENTLSLSKIADSLCTKLGYKSRDAVIYDDNKIYTNEEHKEQLEIYKDELDGNTIFLGEGVYYQKKFKPHMMKFTMAERSSATIVSPLESERTRILNTMILSLKDHAYIAPVYCRAIPDDFPPEYFYNLPFNKANDFKYFSAGKDVISQREALNLVEQDQFDQFYEGDIFGELDPTEGEIQTVPVIEIHLDEPQTNEDYETARVCTNQQMERVKAGEITYDELVTDVRLSLQLTLKDNCLWRFKEVGSVDKDVLDQYNEERTFIENLYFLIDSRKADKRADKNVKMQPMYFILFDLTKHKFVAENSYTFWKAFLQVVNEASLYNIHLIFSDTSFAYHDREVGRYYMLSNADSIQDIPRKMKGIDKNLMRLVDTTGEFNALVKLPKDDPDSRKNKDNQAVLQTTLDNIRQEMSDMEFENYKIKVS